MIAFAFLGPDGIPTGGGIRASLPVGAVRLPPPFTTADLPRLRWTGEAWVWRDVGAYAPPSAADLLAQARGEAVRRVTAAIDARRRRESTDLAGQEALYRDKEAEALAYLREAEMAGEPGDLAEYPLLAGEVGVTAETAWQLAQLWANRAAEARAVVLATESLRHRALAEIAAAPDVGEIDRVLAALTLALADLRP